MAMAACSGKLSLEDDVEKRLEEVLEGHMEAWSKVEKDLEVAQGGVVKPFAGEEGRGPGWEPEKCSPLQIDKNYYNI